ncbi:MAG TPA: hypothetical protein VE967_00915 [Gemmatimonadaceae bacterium]|nr:hypothetical protein [Gemmatimonadaceae bacterium]
MLTSRHIRLTGLFFCAAIIWTGCSNESITSSSGKAHGAFDFVPAYLNDFSGAAGSEWSNRLTTTAPLGEKFLGEFGNDSVALNLTGLGAHTQIQVHADLYIIRSWDGADPNWGTDSFTLRADGTVIALTSFSNTSDHVQNFPNQLNTTTNPADFGATAVNTLGYTYWNGVPVDATFSATFTIPHTGSNFNLSFIVKGLQDMTDESWGIDNVQVFIGP